VKLRAVLETMEIGEQLEEFQRNETVDIARILVFTESEKTTVILVEAGGENSRGA
jgi:hypothetical protein